MAEDVEVEVRSLFFTPPFPNISLTRLLGNRETQLCQVLLIDLRGLALRDPLLLHAKSPSFIGDKRINLSWKELAKASAPSTTTGAGGKRPASATNVMNNNASKKGRGGGGGGGLPNQLVNRAFQGLSYG
ncbi:hypothetical protein TEA_009899 [Camellia sinensis var. sinensis]|uniref:Uncharacterized protein n=1 Tax=Camellia sinensis var. sinensis TaxID=542762 RepID=A0A4S4DPM1_CAMSN|nr:hypothetical protein TEA_009899 [Camellia sinensis var. sinensis]